MSRFRTSRLRHLALLIPLGTIVGLLVGLAFNDLLFGLGAGAGLGLLFGILLTVRNPS